MAEESCGGVMRSGREGLFYVGASLWLEEGVMVHDDDDDGGEGTMKGQRRGFRARSHVATSSHS